MGSELKELEVAPCWGIEIGKLQCKKCGMLFVDGAFGRHLAVFHEHSFPLPFQCAMCVKTALRKENMRDHIISKHGPHPDKLRHLKALLLARPASKSTSVQCWLCPQKISYSGFGSHIRTQHANPAMFPDRFEWRKCPLPPCTAVLPTRRAFNDHLNEHGKQRQRDNATPDVAIAAAPELDQRRSPALTSSNVIQSQKIRQRKVRGGCNKENAHRPQFPALPPLPPLPTLPALPPLAFRHVDAPSIDQFAHFPLRYANTMRFACPLCKLPCPTEGAFRLHYKLTHDCPLQHVLEKHWDAERENLSDAVASASTSTAV